MNKLVLNICTPPPAFGITTLNATGLANLTKANPCPKININYMKYIV